jgi:hypothetical protein
MDYEVKNVIVEEDNNKEKSESIISFAKALKEKEMKKNGTGNECI